MANKLWILFWTFARVGAMTFGGGYAMLPILQREIVENHGWATEEEMADYYAIGQCTPGIIAVNVATFVGRKQGGLPGAVAATLGQVFPSVVIIGIIAGVVQAVAELSRCLLRCAGCVADVLRGCCGVVCCIGEGGGAVPGGCAGGNCSGAELLCAHFDGPELLLQLVNLLG